MHIIKTELFQLIAVGFAIGSVMSVAAGGPEVWAAVLPEIVASVLV
jgi:hypothetical protein